MSKDVESIRNILNLLENLNEDKSFKKAMAAIEKKSDDKKIKEPKKSTAKEKISKPADDKTEISKTDEKPKKIEKPAAEPTDIQSLMRKPADNAKLLKNINFKFLIKELQIPKVYHVLFKSALNNLSDKNPTLTKEEAASLLYVLDKVQRLID